MQLRRLWLAGLLIVVLGVAWAGLSAEAHGAADAPRRDGQGERPSGSRADTKGDSRGVSRSTARLDLVGQVGGASYAVVTRHHYAYVGIGPRLVVLDITDPAAPVEVGQSAVLAGIVQDITFDGNFAYVSTGFGGLRILDMSNPSMPVEVGFYSWPEQVIETAVSGDYAYVVVREGDGVGGSVRILDVMNPAKPVEVGFYDPPQYGHPTGIVVAGDYAYITDLLTLRIVDVSHPPTPMEVAHQDVSGSTLDVVVAGGYAFVAGGHGGLRIINVSNPTAPQEVGHSDTPYITSDVFVLGERAYVVDGPDGNGHEGRLRIVNVANPAEPVVVGSYDSTSEDWGHSVSVVGSHVLVAAGAEGLRILNAGEPTSMSEVASYGVLGSSYDIAVAGSYAYISESSLFRVGGGALRIFDVADPRNPVLAGSYSTAGSALGLDVSGQYVYLTESAVRTDQEAGLHVLDASDPSAPQQVAFYDVPNDNDAFNGAYEIEVAGNRAYLGAQDLHILDVTQPTTPTLLSSAEPGSGTFALSGNYLYYETQGCSGRCSAVEILDVSDPTSPEATANPVGSWGGVNDIEAEGSYLYITTREWSFGGGGGLHIFSLANPESPQRVGGYEQYESRAVAVQGNYAYTGVGSVNILDISNASAPEPVSPPHLTASWIREIAVQGELIYAVTADGGLYILRHASAVLYLPLISR